MKRKKIIKEVESLKDRMIWIQKQYYTLPRSNFKKLEDYLLKTIIKLMFIYTYCKQKNKYKYDIIAVEARVIINFGIMIKKDFID